MSQKRIRLSIASWSAVVALSIGHSKDASGQSLPQEPVDSFRLSLGASGPDRQAKMRDALAAMKSAGEVGRALLLPEWQGQYRDGTNRESFEPAVRRFVELARAGLQSKEPIVQRQTARIIAEAGSVNSGAQSYTGAERSVSRDPFLRQSFAALQEELFRLAIEEVGSQLDALYALGRIDCDPEKLATTTRAFFKQSGPEGLKKRLAAADAINQRSLSVSVLARQGRYILPEESEMLRKTFLAVGLNLVPVAVAGLADEARPVRLQCIDAINAITDCLADSDILIRTSIDTALIDRDEVERANRLGELRNEQKSLEPLMKMLRNQIPDIASRGLQAGRTVHTRVDTLLILEDYAVIRKKLTEQSNRMASRSVKEGVVISKDLDPFPIDENGIESVLMALIKGLEDQEPKVRLACANAIEMILLQPDVLDRVRSAKENRLLGAILESLRDEPSPYVTLNLTRILSRIAPGQVEAILPVAVGLLGHMDIDIRIQALAVIKNYGTKADLAVPALAMMVVEGDSDFRLAVMQAIEAVGVAAKPALVPLARNLRHANPQVRTASARALGRFGSMAEGALAALDEVSEDSSTEVRLAVSEAIVRIRSGSK